MTVETRKKVFEKVNPLIKQGLNAGKMNDEQYEKMVGYATSVSKEFDNNILVIQLVNSILAMFDSYKQQEM